MNYLDFQNSQKAFSLKHVLYQLYLLEWIEKLSPESKKEASVKYFESLQHPEKEIPKDTFHDYLIFYGCDNQHPLTFSEFLHDNLFDQDYIFHLTNGLYEDEYHSFLLKDKEYNNKIQEFEKEFEIGE